MFRFRSDAVAFYTSFFYGRCESKQLSCYGVLRVELFCVENALFCIKILFTSFVTLRKGYKLYFIALSGSIHFCVVIS